MSTREFSRGNIHYSDHMRRDFRFSENLTGLTRSGTSHYSGDRTSAISGCSAGYAAFRHAHLFLERKADMAFRHVETLFVQGNIFVLNPNKPPCLVIQKEVNNS